jgi:hypothetical protein
MFIESYMSAPTELRIKLRGGAINIRLLTEPLRSRSFKTKPAWFHTTPVSIA